MKILNLVSLMSFFIFFESPLCLARPTEYLPQVAPLPHDRAQDLVDQFQLTSLLEMEARGLTGAHLKTPPWSGDYWPYYKGAIAMRYGDPLFPSSEDWKPNFEFLQSPARLSQFGDTLSPAEKYDTLVDDPLRTLTRRTLEESRRQKDEHGKIPSWMGLCHGWAAAAIILPRPLHSVSITLQSSKVLTFYPDDLKALISSLWAEMPYDQRLIGSRCEQTEIDRLPSGRIKNTTCFDSNPATWHLAVVNQLGLSQRSLVADLAVGAEVWNHPMISYQYTYFNPITGEGVPSLSDATVKLKMLEKDPFSTYRSPQARMLVGIEMVASFTAESNATIREVDSPLYDEVKNSYFKYDLELDEKGKIVGGEWHSYQHPDFLWVPAPQAKPFSPGDMDLEFSGESVKWNLNEAFPREWKKASEKSSQFGVPMGRVVDLLLEASQ